MLTKYWKINAVYWRQLKIKANKKMALSRIARLKSRLKVHHVNNYKYTIGDKLECKPKAQNKYSSHAIMVLAKKKNKNSKGKTSKNSDK